MKNAQPYRIKSISQYHQILSLPKPQHPLISVINLDTITQVEMKEPMSLLFDFYCISLKRNVNFTQRYGQQAYDFEDGMMAFMSPNQVFGIEINRENESKPSGWMLLIHPDFLWNTALANKIKQYEYFDYSVYEALYLSEKEENTIINIISNIEQEYHSNIDKFSQDIIIAQFEVLLNYS
ncbi:MAG: AraC family transcriptional regulator, partial [Bacteroidota bacterium]